ncbi:MAG: hypothetical protein J7J22_02520 [Candidatus Verstraetearchaeota archaeon]|nr:hypothetical protein [Candidatus Verstraetearchaeota archaeon]
MGVIQILGGVGYTKFYPAEKYHGDAKTMTIGENTSKIQRMIIAGSILRQR